MTLRKDNCGTCGKPRERKRKSGRNCWQCSKSKWREANPMRASYANLRDHARARGIVFTITLEDFEEFATKSEYLERTGPNRNHLTVDRIINSRGYVPGNLQPMTRAKNTEKMRKWDEVRASYPDRWEDRNIYTTDPANIPF